MKCPACSKYLAWKEENGERFQYCKVCGSEWIIKGKVVIKRNVGRNPVVSEEKSKRKRK